LEVVNQAFHDALYSGWDIKTTVDALSTWTDTEIIQAIVYSIGLNGTHSEKKLKKRTGKENIGKLITDKGIKAKGTDPKDLTFGRIVIAYAEVLTDIRVRSSTKMKAITGYAGKAKVAFQDPTVAKLLWKAGLMSEEDCFLIIKSHAEMCKSDVAKSLEIARTATLFLPETLTRLKGLKLGPIMNT
jgi:hypothetical protein